jgi:hypothetical protein
LGKLEAELFPPAATAVDITPDEPKALAFVMDWLRLERSRRAVCHLERSPPEERLPAEALGTAVLVGPYTVATTFWAVGQYFPDGQPVSTRPPLQLRFDYLGGADNPSRRSGTICGLAESWLVAADRDLGFALLRLAQQRGNDDLDGPVLNKRKWMEFQGAYVTDGDPILILQHPRGRPIALSVGVIQSADVGSSRISYSAGTQPGSAGAPCFDSELRLIALHEGKFGAGNRGVRVDAIRRHLIENGIEFD